ncbi:hypothetical protein ACS0TY_007284 [Phlomoides rotata]
MVMLDCLYKERGMMKGRGILSLAGTILCYYSIRHALESLIIWLLESLFGSLIDNLMMVPKKLVGVTILDVVRANTFMAEVLGLGPREVSFPMVGGYAGFSSGGWSCRGDYFASSLITGKTFLLLYTRVNQIPNKSYSTWWIEVVQAKGGAGSATLSMIRILAYATVKFVDVSLRGLRGDAGIIKYNICSTYLEKTAGRLLIDGSFAGHRAHILCVQGLDSRKQRKSWKQASIQKEVSFIGN